MDGVSFVVPVHNGADCIRDTLASILAQKDDRPMEVIVVDDCSRDRSSDILRELSRDWPLRIVAGEGSGAAAAINAGIRSARHPIICQVDQDVVLATGWMQRLTDELRDPEVAAAQGYYVTDPESAISARVMNLDLEQRYGAIPGARTDHVCTGNAVYRASALHQVGLFDESFGYGYDNDMSYRLQTAGYRLALCREARSVHRWREGVRGYLVQQYGFGYGRLDLVARHPSRCRGDAVSPIGMMLHPAVMTIAMLLGTVAGVMAMAGGFWTPCAAAAALLVAALCLERSVAGVRAASKFQDRSAFLFPWFHLLRDLAWVAAIATWTARRCAGAVAHPSHSMRPRVAALAERARSGIAAASPSRRRWPLRALCLIPAHNEGANLPAVVAEIRARCPDLDILIVDDGSTDMTWRLLDRLDVRWIRLPERMGIGGAMRTGLRYAARLGYEVVIRMDGDGQHRAEDIERLLVPVQAGTADVVLGSRYGRRGDRTLLTHLAQRTLAACLSALTRVRVTDPTSGFCVLGPRAVRLLAEHHPTGYAEPELRLFLSRNALSVMELPVRARPRLSGSTSLTAGRVTSAGARVVLAMIIVPFRGRVEGAAGD